MSSALTPIEKLQGLLNLILEVLGFGVKGLVILWCDENIVVEA